MSDKDNSNNFMWFLAGLGFGALLGVLYAPRAGKETREAILNTAQEGKEYLRRQGREVGETVSGWVDRGKDTFNRQKERIGGAIEEMGKAYRESGEGSKNS